MVIAAPGQYGDLESRAAGKEGRDGVYGTSPVSITLDGSVDVFSARSCLQSRVSLSRSFFGVSQSGTTVILLVPDINYMQLD